MNEHIGPRKRRRLALPNAGAYALKHVLEDIPLNAEDNSESISITYVEHWNDNLYIGTSASEILHLVGLPSENDVDPPTFILASRLQPGGYGAKPLLGQSPGVQKILLLPGAAKACVLCNGSVSFYSLPELSPAFPGREPTGVQWIGGVDENLDIHNDETAVIMMATSRRIQMVRIGDKVKQIRSVDFPGCHRASRRETIACVADSTSYSLLEVEHQQRIPLSSIASNRQDEEPSQTSSSNTTSRADTSSAHSRSKSLGNFATPGQEGSNPKSAAPTLEPPESEPRARSPASAGSDSSRPSSRPRSSTDVSAPQTVGSTGRLLANLRPHALSPSPEEFMFTTGTAKNEPGVGVFVNLDGDVSRGTIEFERYPDSLIVYDFKNENNPAPTTGDEAQFVLALLDKSDVPGGSRGIEIQELSSATNIATGKDWIDFPNVSLPSSQYGLHQCLSGHRHTFQEIADLLQSVRYKPSLPQLIVEADPRTKASIDRLEQETALFENQSPQATSPTPEYEQRRTEEEKAFVARLGHTTTKAVTWSGNQLWQILPNPLLLQLEYKLLQSGVLRDDLYAFDGLNVSRLMSLLGSIRDREPRDETEYLTLNYIRQKTSLILFLHLQTMIRTDTNIEKSSKMVGSALEDGQIDPRVVLLLIPPLAQEAIQGPNGIWLSQGIVDVLVSFNSTIEAFKDAPIDFWLVLRQYLTMWQGKRGYGSIADEKFVFDSVDAALLHTLLYLDQALPEGSGMQTSVRTKLNNVVDHWKGDFQRAIVLLEHYRRLFVLSRLYQSRKLARDVLATWKRIAEGEDDEDKTLTVETVEVQIRRYLTKISNANLVQEYGLWLAKRNPDLAIQIFADDESRVKLTPAQVVSMLKTQAPGAVQKYLEHLVFSKHLDQYADDLIGYYLDSVLSVLETSDDAKQSLEQSYATYRALISPKPTYLNFIAENAPQQSWWQSRLRLLQLLGSGGYATTSSAEKELTYSVEKVLERLTPFSSYLVSESIILDARQGRHKEALRLLTHGLGDYDTAVRYCYFGGPAPTSSQPIDASLLPSRETQQDLFNYLFQEFLRIEDIEERLDRTSHLLGTFAGWFDPLTVFDDIPGDWTVSMLSEFLLRSFRVARSERNQAIIIKALSAAQNLQKQAEFIEVCEKFGSQIQAEAGNDTQLQNIDSAVS